MNKKSIGVFSFISILVTVLIYSNQSFAASENYFTNLYNINSSCYFIIGISIAFVLIGLILWILFGKDKTVVDTVEFYPPEGYNSAEVAFLYKGSVDNKAVVSLLIYLASKGYLKIEEIKQGDNLSATSNEYIITKLKEYDGNNDAEKIFFYTLFMFKNSVKLSDLSKRFYITVDKIKEHYNKKQNMDKIFDKKSIIVKNLIIPMILVIFILISGKPIFDTYDTNTAITTIMFQIIGSTILIKELFQSKAKISKVFPVVLGALFVGIPLLFMVLPTIFTNPIYLVTYIIGIICIIILFMLRKIILKRTSFGLEMFGKIKGFKRFLETAEKEQIEELVEKNPSYFYDVLPYTYSLDVSEKWVEQFGGIGIQPPSWFLANADFLINTFGILMSLTVDAINTTVKSAQSSEEKSFMDYNNMQNKK